MKSKLTANRLGKSPARNLRGGWNFADAGGPITAQARKVLKMVFAKNDVFYQRWRSVQLSDFPKWAQGPKAEKLRKEELAKLDGQIKGLERTINEARKPRPHHFEFKLAAN